MFCTPTMPVIFVPSLNEVTILMPDGGAVIASQVPRDRRRGRRGDSRSTDEHPGGLSLKRAGA